jgi:hypothetical protein
VFCVLSFVLKVMGFRFCALGFGLEDIDLGLREYGDIGVGLRV